MINNAIKELGNVIIEESKNKRFIFTYAEVIPFLDVNKEGRKVIECKFFESYQEAEKYFLDKVYEFRQHMTSINCQGIESLTYSSKSYHKKYMFDSVISSKPRIILSIFELDPPKVVDLSKY